MERASIAPPDPVTCPWNQMPNNTLSARTGTLTAVVLWTILWVLALYAIFDGTASVALMDPDEGRNGEVAREMVVRGDYLIPHFNGLPYLDKPVFFFAATAASIKALGATEFAARLPGILFTLATVAMVIGFGRRYVDRSSALLAGLALATSPLVLTYSRLVIFDATMMFWVTLSVVAFHISWKHEGLGWRLLGWAAAGFAVLTKGPVGLVLPLLISFAEGLVCRDRVRRLFHPAGIALFVLVVAPWFFYVVHHHPEFPHYAFIRETFERVATDSMKRTGPPWYILAFLVGGSFPWFPALLFGWRHLLESWRERAAAGRTEVFLMLWILIPLVFFTLSQSKRPGYILPVLPAVALLAGRILLRSPAALRYTAVTAAVAAAALGALLLFGSDELANRVRGDGIVAALRQDGPVLGGIMLAVALIAAIGIRVKEAALAGLVLFPVALLVGTQPMLDEVGKHRSARALANAIKDVAPDGARVIGVSAFMPSLPYYMQRPTEMATHGANGIPSNYIDEYAEALAERPGSTLHPPTWWQQELETCSEPTVFLVKNGNEPEQGVLASRLPLIATAPRYSVYGPCATGGER
jgi:4-amino-4-deoxy-L-arabinose transferase-like glycosyltransferase